MGGPSLVVDVCDLDRALRSGSDRQEGILRRPWVPTENSRDSRAFRLKASGFETLGQVEWVCAAGM